MPNTRSPYKLLCFSHSPPFHYSHYAWVTCGETRIELRNLQILKKLLDNSSQFLSSEQPSEPKNLDVALNIARVGKIRSENLRLWSIRVLNGKSDSDGENLCPLCSVILKSV